MDTNLPSAFSMSLVSRLCVITSLAFCLFLSLPERGQAQPEEAFGYLSETFNEYAMTEGASDSDVFQDAGQGRDNCEGATRNRSRFPEHPELFRPMPIHDPAKKPPRPSKDEPEVPENHTIENRKAPSSEKVNGRFQSRTKHDFEPFGLIY